jgi:FlaA1/EpsC-like NDP-sugar epimerase
MDVISTSGSFGDGKSPQKSGNPARYLWRFRRRSAPLLDSGAWILAILAASLLRFKLDSARALTDGLLVAIGIAVVLQLSIGFLVLYWRRWRLGSFEEIVALTATISGVTLILLVASLAFIRHDLPVGVAIAGGAFTLVLTAGGRCAWRLVREFKQHAALQQGEDVIVFGLGEAGQQITSTLLTTPNSPFHPVALLDDDPAKRNLQIRHLHVGGGRKDLDAVAKRTRASTLVVAIPSASSELIRQLSGLASGADLDIRVLPPVSRLFAREVGVEDLRPVTDADLLGRHAVDTEIELVAGYLTGRRVLVTGAGGSIGSELCRQIHKLAPSTLIILDRDESGIHQTQLSIEGRAMLDNRSLVVCDIRDYGALNAVFAEHQPEVVFHAAALKHLPLLEMWPAEAVKTNVQGTLNVLRAASAHGVDRFVNISTDKAADPCSVLGYTKRIAERLTATVGMASPGTYISVRFGNVLGSRGSVLTTFRAQIEAGGPVTVTDPNVTRYFMTVEESVQLTIQAGALGDSGDVLVLDMGSPVSIAAVAERLVKESPRRVRVIYTGLRPAEKLHEILFGQDETDIRAVHRLISSITVPSIDLRSIESIDLETSPQRIKQSLQDCHDVVVANE